jgi:hypothetical protein
MSIEYTNNIREIEKYIHLPYYIYIDCDLHRENLYIKTIYTLRLNEIIVKNILQALSNVIFEN